MKQYIKRFSPLAFFLLLPAITYAAGKPSEWTRNDTERVYLAGFFIFLLLIIATLAKTIKATLEIKNRKEKNKNSSTFSKGTMSALLLMLGLGISTSSFAEEVASEVVKEPFFLSTVPGDIIAMTILIIIEVVIVFVLAKIQWDLLKVEKPKLEKKKSKYWSKFFQKVNDTVAIEDEASIDLQHDYDGIRELDNKVPGWWAVAFLSTILIGIIYLIRMFGTGTLPDQITELEEANKKFEISHAAYLKNSANNVDENTVVMLDAAGIDAGKALYTEKGCNACHGVAGEGSVGPNLTDDAWLHKGSIKDIFKSIKYGIPDKGMIAWESQLSPVQIAQVASYIKSMKGSNPPNAKAPQGEVYKDEDAGAGSTEAAPTEKKEEKS